MAKARKNKIKETPKPFPKKESQDTTISTDLSFEDLVKMSMQPPPKKKETMTFEEREQQIFFDVISDLTGHHDNTGVIEIGLTKEQIIKRVSEKITRKRAIELFEHYVKTDIHYLDGQSEWVWRISAAGRVLYWEHLKAEAEKTELDKDSIKSTIKTGLYTRRNMWIVGGVAFVSMVFVILNFINTSQRERRELEKEIRELQLRLLESQQRPQNNTPNSQIHLHFSDTSLHTLKVKSEK